MAFNDTANLERSYLCSILKSLTMCRRYIQGGKSEWFTSEPRKFIFQIAQDTFATSRTHLTESVFLYEVSKSVEPSVVAVYHTEWNIVSGITVADPVEAIAERLSQAWVARQMMHHIEQIVERAEKGELDEALSIYKRTAMSLGSGGMAHPTTEITDYKHRAKLIADKKSNPEKYMGIKTGFSTFDKRTGGLFAGELTLVAGVTGLGKSTLTKQLAVNIVFKNKGKNVLLVTNEESQLQVETKLDALITEIPYLDFKLARIESDESDKWVDAMESRMKVAGVGRIFVKEVPAFTDVTLVEQAYRELEAQGIKIGVIIIDHLPHIMPIQKAHGENDERGKAASDCKQLSKDLDCAVVIPTQAATEVEEKQSKGKRAGKLDVYGSKAQIHVSNTFMIITDKGKVSDEKLEEWQQDVNWLVDIKKNRDGPPFCFRARHYVQFGKVVETFEKDSQYSEEAHTVAKEGDEAEALREALREAEVATPVVVKVEPALKEPVGVSEPEQSIPTRESLPVESAEEQKAEMEPEPEKEIEETTIQVLAKKMSVLERMRMKKITMGEQN